MGATRQPVITNPGNDPGRNQPRENRPEPSDARSGKHRDMQSMAHNPGGAASTRRTWFGSGSEPDGAGHEAMETGTHNGEMIRDRGNRAV